MNLNDSSAIIEALKKSNNTGEVYEVRHYEMYRPHKDGGELITHVKVSDRGPGANQRYRVSATNEEGRETGPNADDDLEKAILFCHWYELDK